MGIRDLAAKARARLRADPTVEEGMDRATGTMGDKFDNATDDRYSAYTDRAQDAVNERIDDFTGGEGTRQNRDPMDPRR